MNKILSALLLCLMVCVSASAATRTWKGGTGANGTKWSVGTNWVGDTAPSATDDVIIPAGCDVYPVLTEATTCGNIYFQVIYLNASETSSARIKNQHLLTYTEAFCDVTITANRWVRVTAPLKNTFSGDYFTEHQTLDKTAWNKTATETYGDYTSGATGWPFVEAQYAYSEKNDHPTDFVNRAKKGTYYSYYSSNRIVEQADGTNTKTFMQQWGDPSNSLATEIQPAMGFDVWVNYGTSHRDDEVTFHFPSGTGWYGYFGDGGNISPRAGEIINREAATQGKLALDKSDMKDGKANFTVTRDGDGKHSKMFAVGNPGIAYLDIARFIHKNVDLGNIYRYVYTHNDAYAGRGTENIYFYSRRSGDKLYKLTTAVGENEGVATGNTDPNGGATTTAKSEISKATRPSFINPAEGFRVFGGGVSYKCAVPELVGIYSSARATIAPAVCEKYYKNGSWQSDYTNTQVPMLKDGYIDFDYSVTVTDNPNQVRINNFLNLGSVVATINTTNQTLTIPAGSKIMAVIGGSGKCDGDTDHDLWNFTETSSPATDVAASTYGLKYSGANIRVLNIYGLNDDNWTFGSTKHGLYPNSGTKTVYANNVTNQVTKTSANDIVLKYTIDDDDAVHIDMTPANCKKILVRSDAVSNSQANMPAYHHDSSYPASCLCEAWYAFEGMNSVKPADTGTEFIMLGQQMEGSFKTQTANKENNVDKFNGVDEYTFYEGIEIARIAGRTDVVSIKGLYPNDKTTLALGQIRKEVSSTVYGQMPSIITSTNKTAGNRNGTLGDFNISLTNSYRYSDNTVYVGNRGTFTISSTRAFEKVVMNVYNGRAWSASSGDVTTNNKVVTWTGNATNSLTLTLGNNAEYVYDITITPADGIGDVTYILSIPAGQLVHVSGTEPAPESDFYFYSHGNAAVRMRTIEMTWHPSATGDGYWETTSLSDNKGCRGTMVTRVGLQPDGNVTGNVGAIIGEVENNKHHCYIRRTGGSSSAADSWEPDEDFSENDQSTSSYIDLTFTPDMFQANMADANNEAALTAPARVAAAATNAPVFITAVAAEDMVANTMIEVDPEASDAFHPMEDAPLFDVADYSFAFGTLAGSHLVAVNSIASAELIPLYLSQSATLTFENIATLGEAYLYDAATETRTLITNNTPYALVIEEGQQAGRYFIETNIEAPEQTTAVENVETFGWKPVAYCPTNGALAVACADEAVRFEVYNVSGQLVGNANGSHTFYGLNEGAYVVSATRGAEKQTLKVIVY